MRRIVPRSGHRHRRHLYGGEPIWVTGERQGMVTACFFWPGSEAAIKGVRPTLWNKYDGSVPNSARVATVLEWLRMPDARRPHVITLYFSDVDSASHRGPIEGPDVEKAVMAMDAALGTLLDGIDALPDRDRVILLLTSDHGMATHPPRRPCSWLAGGYVQHQAELQRTGGRASCRRRS